MTPNTAENKAETDINKAKLIATVEASERVLCVTRHRIGRHFRDKSFQAITCTGTDNAPKQKKQEPCYRRDHRAMRPDNNVSAKLTDDCARISTLQSYHYSAVKLFSKYSIQCDHGT